MSRFVNLEFEGESDQDRFQGARAKDEAFYLGEAVGAFESANFEAALRAYSKVLEFNADNVNAWLGQVRILIELGEYSEARLWADKALQRYPHEAQLLAAKAVALARLGSVDEALACSDASIEEQGDTPYLWLARGDVLLARREKRADYCFEKALLLAPRNWFITWLAARARAYYRQFASALKLLQQAVEWNAGQAAVWLDMGRCQTAIGLLGAARNSYSQAQQLQPNSLAVSKALSDLSSTNYLTRVAAWLRNLIAP